MVPRGASAMTARASPLLFRSRLRFPYVDFPGGLPRRCAAGIIALQPPQHRKCPYGDKDQQNYASDEARNADPRESTFMTCGPPPQFGIRYQRERRVQRGRIDRIANQRTCFEM